MINDYLVRKCGNRQIIVNDNYKTTYLSSKDNQFQSPVGNIVMFFSI